MIRFFDWIIDVRADADRTVIGPRPQVIGPSPETIGPSGPDALVEAPARFAWDEKRWIRTLEGKTSEYSGPYRTFDRSTNRWRQFDGLIRQEGRQISAYIADPPEAMRHHRHGACLQLVEVPWFRLHFQRQPRTVDDALLYMEQMLDESINS